MVAGVFLGYDQPKSLGNYAAGGSLAAPVFKDFMEQVLKNKKDIAFRVPEGVSLVRVNRETGKPATVNDSNFNVVLEAFKEGTEPFGADNSKVNSFTEDNENSSSTEETETNFDGIY